MTQCINNVKIIKHRIHFLPKCWQLSHVYRYTLTCHFIRYTLLVPCRTPFCLQNCLNSSWHIFNKVLEHSSEILVHIDMIASRSSCRFVGCTSMTQISHSTTSQRCSIGLRSGYCGGHLSKVNSLSCSRNQSEMIWALWHGALSCWKYIRRWYTVVIKGWTWSATILRKAVAFKRCSIGTKGPKVCHENIPPHHYTTTTTSLNRWDKAGWVMLSCSLCQILTLPSECRSRNRDSSEQAMFFQSSIVPF